VVQAFLPVLRPTATVYICSDWLTSTSVFDVATRHFQVRNRITWQRDKGRGSRVNWKNNSEDIWFCTVGDDYCFNVDQVRQRRPVVAPYRNADRSPRDWQESSCGRFRDTCPSNLWTDITVPFWSMPENTGHPTQKSEKLMARLILASSRPDETVFDPFAGCGSSCVVAAKTGRRYLGIELEREYALLALRRLELAREHPAIQGYRDGVFWPRNSGK
jgi:site-specific DNA-methyltransferase (adenine-specific)